MVSVRDSVKCAWIFPVINGVSLDLVMTFADCQLDVVTGIVSDHALMVCCLTATNTTPKGTLIIDHNEIRRLLRA